ncbi:MAG: hypothetical protein LBV62_00605 [Rickettsiales bacterium]|jgi:hypothetical protein|nr:hypothetical protein [Rickettsiales bacterium]
MTEKQQLLSDLHDIEVDTIKKEKNFDFRTALISLFKALYKLFESKQDVSKKDLANAAEKESKRLGLEGRYNWNEIFSSEEKVVQSVKKQNNIEQKLNGDPYPNNFYVGKAISNGSCFFDSFRKGLEQQKEIKVTAQQLRMDCKRFAQNNPPEWFKSAIAHSYDNNGQHRNETVDAYTANIMDNSRWGDPEVEGRILCEKYGLKLHIIEKYSVEGQEIWTNQIVDESKSESVNEINYNEVNIIRIINRGALHFEPLLDRNKNLAKQTQEDLLLARQLQEEEDLLYTKQLQERKDYLLAMKFQEQEYSYARVQTSQEQSDRLLAARLQKEELTKHRQGQEFFSSRCGMEEPKVEAPHQQKIPPLVK